MVITILDENLTKSGAELLKQLDSENIGVDAALWFYYPDIQNWKLLLSFPDVISLGPKVAYEIVQRIISKTDGINFSLDDVVITKNDAPLLSIMRTAINTGPGINGIRFSNNVINGQFIQDAHIYRLMRVTAPDNKKPTMHRIPKVGRNELCPCGSGKKYKKCHGSSSQVVSPTGRNT